ncbi:magnetosome protein MamC [Marichromatium gracile]|uniref:Uncharacterized protein n=1 Tax=Marichromatium gracile TaxID=1048 RepID=A0A4R4A5L0_MARGR|nr:MULTISPECIES: magnetosome protein MamC [Marichromatium]MBO8086312.1 magnetosome protein MamC [Marichromatium sp.]MCF1181862.1 magnetosome protein MamC [Marichromatium gracile]TCW34043.1 hypothetical protein EDC29_11326 [Marichromatium gracile]
MSQPPVFWPGTAPTAPAISSDCGSLVRLATLGAVIGGSLAAARQVDRIQAGEQLPNLALVETGKSAVAAGVATAAAGAVASTVADQGALRLGLMFLAGSAVFYGLRQWTDGDMHD